MDPRVSVRATAGVRSAYCIVHTPHTHTTLICCYMLPIVHAPYRVTCRAHDCLLFTLSTHPSCGEILLVFQIRAPSLLSGYSLRPDGAPCTSCLRDRHRCFPFAIRPPSLVSIATWPLLPHIFGAGDERTLVMLVVHMNMWD